MESDDLHEDKHASLHLTAIGDSEQDECSKSSHYKYSPQEKLAEALQRSENTKCADCNAPSPRWASVSYGCIICTQCAGVHRSLGAHISFVMSCTLDNWTIEQVETLCSAGNKLLNQSLEYSLPEHVKPHPDSSRFQREQYIRAKYDTQLYRSHTSELESMSPQAVYAETGASDAIPGGETGHPRKSSSMYGMVEYVGVLMIELVEGVDIKHVDEHKNFDPYILLRLGEQTIKSMSLGTDRQSFWNEKLMLSWDGVSGLFVEMYDRKRFSADRIIGGFQVDADLLQELLCTYTSDEVLDKDLTHPLVMDSWYQVSLDHCRRAIIDVNNQGYNDEIRKFGSAYRPIKNLAKIVTKNIRIKKSRSALAGDVMVAGAIHLRLSLQRF